MFHHVTFVENMYGKPCCQTLCCHICLYVAVCPAESIWDLPGTCKEVSLPPCASSPAPHHFLLWCRLIRLFPVYLENVGAISFTCNPL